MNRSRNAFPSSNLRERRRRFILNGGQAKSGSFRIPISSVRSGYFSANYGEPRYVPLVLYISLLRSRLKLIALFPAAVARTNPFLSNGGEKKAQSAAPLGLRRNVARNSLGSHHSSILRGRELNYFKRRCSANCYLMQRIRLSQWSLALNYQRRSRGPSLAPIQAQRTTIAPYQIATNGRESSEQ
jgi:hypothetical protein